MVWVSTRAVQELHAGMHAPAGVSKQHSRNKQGSARGIASAVSGRAPSTSDPLIVVSLWMHTTLELGQHAGAMRDWAMQRRSPVQTRAHSRRGVADGGVIGVRKTTLRAFS